MIKTERSKMKRPLKAGLLAGMFLLSGFGLGYISGAGTTGLLGTLSGVFQATMSAGGHSLPPREGSYYRKVATTFGNWTGIEGTVTLGYPSADYNHMDPFGLPLDGFNIYMGGNAGGVEEVDAGLGWDYCEDKQGTVSGAKVGWRPFWRNGNWHSAPLYPDDCWHPGDTVVMSVVLDGPRKLRLTVKDAGPNPRRIFTQSFLAPWFRDGVSRQFKRVNSIDQYGNEGHQAKPTEASVIDAIWQDTRVILTQGHKHQAVPLTGATRLMLSYPPGHVVTSSTAAQKAAGGESISIYGTMPATAVASPEP